MSNRKMGLIKIENGDRAHTNGETFVWNSGTAWAVVDTNNNNAIWHVSADRDDAVEALEREIAFDSKDTNWFVTVGKQFDGHFSPGQRVVKVTADGQRQAFRKVAKTLKNGEIILHVTIDNGR